MSTQIAIGVSTKLDSSIAGKEAATNAYSQIPRGHPDMLIVFISPIFNQGEVIESIRTVIKQTPLVGCSSAGTLTNLGALRNSICVCALVSDSMKFSYGASKEISINQRLAGDKAARASSYLKNVTKQAYIIFSDGLSGNNADLLRGTQEIIGTSFPVIGGCASDNLRFKKTYQYLNENLYSDSIVGLLISGSTNIGIGHSHGWQPLGKPHKITKADSNIVKEIDRQYAAKLYEEYLNKGFDELKKEGIAKLGSSYPLGCRIRGRKEYLMRVPLKINDDGSLVLSAEIPEGEDVNLMVGDKNLILDAAKNACRQALKNARTSKIKFAIVFSDIGRLQVLRKDSQKEVEIIKEALGEDVPFFGCYTCGEYIPFDLEGYTGQCFFQNQTISVAVFY